MNLILAFALLAATEIDGIKLWQRARSTASQRSYHKQVQTLTADALDQAWVAAGRGEYRFSYCLPEGGTEELRGDVAKALNKVYGIMASPRQPTNTFKCIDVSWEQL